MRYVHLRYVPLGKSHRGRVKTCYLGSGFDSYPPTASLVASGHYNTFVSAWYVHISIASYYAQYMPSSCSTLAKCVLIKFSVSLLVAPWMAWAVTSMFIITCGSYWHSPGHAGIALWVCATCDRIIANRNVYTWRSYYVKINNSCSLYIHPLPS